MTKNDKTPFKVFTPFWRTAEKIYLSLPPSKNYVIKKKTQTNPAHLWVIESQQDVPHVWV